MPHFPTDGTTREQPKRFMLITNPRTCSNLLVRILAPEKQPDTVHGGYHFLGCTIAMAVKNIYEKNAEEWTEEQTQFAQQVYKSGIEALEKNLAPTENTKICFTKEHVETITEPTALARFINGPENNNIKPWRWEIPGYNPEFSEGNTTIFPDAYLESWNPIMLVRHPARAFESIYRSFIDVFKTPVCEGASDKSKEKLIQAHMTLSWTKSLYEWYKTRGMSPIIIDAEDVVVNTEGLTKKLADYIGFDRDLLQYKWNELGSDDQAKQAAHLRRMLSSLNDSNGVKADPAKLSANIKSAEELVPKWTEEFGEETANNLRRWVDESMPDYEYLRERRMRP